MAGDLTRLQGTWRIAALETDGRKMAPAAFAASTIVVKGTRFTTSSMGAIYEGTITVDSSHTPRRFDMQFTRGPEKGSTSLGIYELAGDRWKICLTMSGAVRPSAFATAAGSGLALEVLKREKAGAQAKATTTTAAAPPAAAKTATVRPSSPTAPRHELDGEWAMLAHVKDGKPLEDSFVKFCRRVTGGGATTVFAADRVMMSARFAADGSASPKRIDYFTGKRAAGKPAAGKPAQLGIYAIDGDRLSICMAAAGRPRPADLASGKGDGRVLTVWKLTGR